jgi:hypothetical protein
MPAADGGTTYSGGRRPKASIGRNRDGERMAVPRALWGFGRGGARGGVSVRRWMAKVVGLRHPPHAPGQARRGNFHFCETDSFWIK